MDRRMLYSILMIILGTFIGLVHTEARAQRFDLRQLGIPYKNAIPSGESAITSLVLGTDGRIFGGTTGEICHLFAYSPQTNRVKPLGQFDGHQSIHHALAVGTDGMLYIGTGLNEIMQYPISKPVKGRDGITRSLWNDIKTRYREYDGGKLYRYDPFQKEPNWVEIGEPCGVETLGIAVPHDGIYTITASPIKPEIYGVTYPHGRFFVYSIDKNTFSDKGELYKETVYGGPNRTLRSITRRLICDNMGNVYGSADNHTLFKYDIEKEEIIKLRSQIPHIYIAVVEAFVKDKNGLIYGGTSEGFLFKFDAQTEVIINLGKPIDQMRIRALTIGSDGKVYGIAGERTNRCHFFSYDPASGGYSDFGSSIDIDRTPYYKWRGEQFDAMMTGANGIIYIGESEWRSHLFLFKPIAL
jgi:hypothetical protein